MKQFRTLCALAYAAALSVLAGGAAFAQAKLTDFVGKVEIKPPSGAWAPARKGMTIAPGSLVSTGFKSKAVIELDQSTLFVNQLTRLTLEELVRKQNEITTRVSIRAGSLAAEVKTGGSQYKHDFRVKSPVSTAAVRGTKIFYDGNEMSVEEGTAVLYNLLHQPMTTYKGDSALTGDGLDAWTSALLRRQRFELAPWHYRPTSSNTAGGASSTQETAIVVFTPNW